MNQSSLDTFLTGSALGADDSSSRDVVHQVGTVSISNSCGIADILSNYAIQTPNTAELNFFVGVRESHLDKGRPEEVIFTNKVRRKYFIGYNLAINEFRRAGLTAVNEDGLLDIAKKIYLSARSGYRDYNPHQAVADAFNLSIKPDIIQAVIITFFEGLGIIRRLESIARDRKDHEDSTTTSSGSISDHEEYFPIK